MYSKLMVLSGLNRGHRLMSVIHELYFVKPDMPKISLRLIPSQKGR